MKRLVFMVILIAGIIILDQWSKIEVSTSFRLGESVRVIDGFFNLTYVKNSGAAFGFGNAFDNWLRYSHCF